MKTAVAARKKAELSAKNTSVKKVPSTIHKTTQNRRSSLTLSTPLKEKSPNSSTISVLSSKEPFTPPKPSQLSTSTPFTEGRSRRTAATKADKYIDIVSRRLAEVPANGSTPKSMKIASKLISEATPNSRRNILLSQSLTSTSIKPSVTGKKVESTPIAEKSKAEAVVVPAPTPASVRKRNRTAKIHQMFQTPLMSLAAAANEESSDSSSFSPSSVNVAPSTISRVSKLNQVHFMSEDENKFSVPFKASSPVKSTAKAASKKTSPLKESVKKPSPIKESVKKPSPFRRSPRVSPLKIEEPVAVLKPHVPPVAATPKAPVVEFVAPQSVLRSSKRPRKQTIFNDETSSIASPAVIKQAKLADPSIFPTVSVNSQSQVKITPQTPAFVPAVGPAVVPMPQSSVPQSTRSSNVPAIIVPLSAAKPEESSSVEDLHDLSKSTRKTPLRVQPAKTPTRAKAVIPSLSDYSAATKIAVIEVAKNTSNNNNTSVVSNIASSTPKVEPWTSKFMQKEAPVKAALNINVKPVDTSKISGFSSASVPIVPKFPLNLANISNITKTSLITEPIEVKPVVIPVPNVPAQSAVVQDAYVITTASASTSTSTSASAVPHESPLTRAKRIDLENSNREEKIKTMMETKADKLKKAMSDLKSSEKRIEIITNVAANNNAASSKLPVKPKANATVLPSPKIPSRLAEAFSGIDSELPPIDIGLVDDEKILKNVLNGASTKEAISSTATSTAPSGFVNPKMKKTPAIVNNENKPINNNVNPTATPNNSATQLHKTAVLNSAARKINESKPAVKSQVNPVNIPSTPKPLPSKTENSSPFLPEIPSDDELERREKMVGKENRPTWAMTPNLTVALNAQRSQRAEDVFGKVQPIKLEDFFKGSGKKFPNRSSTSNWNNNI